jgi:hypothetical protein
MAVVKIVPMPGVAVVGPTGPQGPIGLTGPAGTNGTNGINGTNGTNGADGSQLNYWDGIQQPNPHQPAEPGFLVVDGITRNSSQPLYIGAADKIYLTANNGEFINDPNIPENQIATIGDIESVDTLSNGLVVTGQIDDTTINPAGTMSLSVQDGYAAFMDLIAHSATFNGNVYISNLGEDKQTTINTPTQITNDLYVTGKINGGTSQIILKRNSSLPLGPNAPLTLDGNTGGYGIPFDNQVFSNKISWSDTDLGESMDIVFQEAGIYTLDLSAQFAKNESIPVADVAIYTLAYVPTPPTWNPTKFDGSLRIYRFKEDYGTISYNSVITIPHSGYRARIFIWSPQDCALSNIESNFISAVANPSSGACTLIVTKLANIE